MNATTTTLYMAPFGILAMVLALRLIGYQPPLWLKRAGPWAIGVLAVAGIALALIPHR